MVLISSDLGWADAHLVADTLDEETEKDGSHSYFGIVACCCLLSCVYSRTACRSNPLMLMGIIVLWVETGYHSSDRKVAAPRLQGTLCFRRQDIGAVTLAQIVFGMNMQSCSGCACGS